MQWCADETAMLFALLVFLSDGWPWLRDRVYAKCRRMARSTKCSACSDADSCPTAHATRMKG